MQPLSMQEHDALILAVKTIAAYDAQRALTEDEKRWIEWLAMELTERI